MAESTFWGSGWAFPPSFECGSREVNLVRHEQNINQAIDIILGTRKGERSVLSEFGSPLSNYMFRTMNATLRGEIANAVRASLLDHEPRITVDKVNVDLVDDGMPRIEIAIGYTVKKTNSRHNHVYPFSIVEGTNLLVQ